MTTVVRPVLEYACPVWHSGLTAAHSELLESVQKRAIRIIYPDANYQTSLIVAGIDTLDVKRLHGVVFYFYFSVIVLYTLIFVCVMFL